MYVYRIYVQPYAMFQLSTTLINQGPRFLYFAARNAQQLQTALISEHQITTSSKRLLLNLALRNGYLALQPGRITCPPFAHDSPCVYIYIYSLPSSESIEGKHLAKRLCHVRQFQLTILSKFNDFFRSFDGSLWGIRAAASLAFCWSMRC